MKVLTVLCDVDDVVAQLVPAWLARYNRDYGDCVTRDDLKSWTITDWISAECGEKIYDYLRDPMLYEDVAPVSGARAGVEMLRRWGHRVVFVTSASGPGMGAKLAWLVRHGFLPDHTYVHPDFVAAHDKALIRGDVLIDDRPENIAKYVKTGAHGIVMDAPWNQLAVGLRARHWRDVLAHIDHLSLGRAA